MLDKLRDERGFVLILVIMLLAAMTAIATAALMTSNTDMLIARNEKDSKNAFYLAETGIEETVGRMDLSNSNARFIGETQAQKTARLANPAANPAAFETAANSTFNSASLNLSNTGGTYAVTVTYARETTGEWCKAGCDNQIVLYGQDFGFIGAGVPTIGYVPVYQIDSVGTTTSGTTATIRAYITASTLNVVPPAGDIFSNTTITIGGVGAVNGALASNDAIAGCDPAEGCNNVNYAGADAVMQTYLGIDLSELPSHADAPSPYVQSGNTIYQEANNNLWGVACSANDDIANIPVHICENEAKIIFIDNDDPATNNDVRIPGGAGRGILVVTGDLNLSGNLVWEGMIYIMGSLQGNGTVTCFGTIMANNTINFNGSINAAGSVEVAQSVADMAGASRMLRWTRL